MRRSACGYGNGYGQPQPDMNMNYHRTHSEHVTKFAGNPCHAGGGAVQHHTAVHKESFKEVDGDCYDPRLGHHQQQLQAHRPQGYNNNNNHGRHNGGGGGSAHRYETTYEETFEEEETYSAGRHHGHGSGGARRYEYETYEETSYEEEEEEVVGGGGYAQLKRGHRCA